MSTEEPLFHSNHLIGPLKSFHKGQQVVRLGLKNGTHLVGCIMDVDDRVVTVARLKSINPYRLHDDYEILLDQIIAVGIDSKHYDREPLR